MEICCLAQETHTGLLINLEGSDGEEDGRKVRREGRYLYLWLTHVEV